MPLWIPILRRELMNRMYTPTAYYFARVTSGILFQFIYPVILSSIIFWCYGVHISPQNFFMFLANACGIVTCGCAIGFFCGVAFSNDRIAMDFMNLLIQYTYLLGGGYGNNNSRDIVNKYLTYASPCRYGAEIYFRIFADNHIPPDDSEERVMGYYGFNLGYHICFPCLYGIAIIIICLGWLIIVRKNSPPKKKK
jgi:ABC-type multidrug transport system permease subunit